MALHFKKAQILIDNPNSWTVEPMRAFVTSVAGQENIDLELIHSHGEIRENDVLFLVGCEKILTQENRNKSRFCLVVHESDLPAGRGWSPLTWQVLEGASRIVVCLLEALDSVDSGRIFGRRIIELSGAELVDDLRFVQIRATQELIVDFLRGKLVNPEAQAGTPTYYQRRRPEDSRLDVNRSIAEQFNLLRVVDNERYPAYFELNGVRYYLRITKERE